ncbi:kinase-like domain-containing protein [Mycena crocata]|nr:kinase-like domain-containing protein [Mycena crocata]
MICKSTVPGPSIPREPFEKNAPELEDYDIMELIGSGRISRSRVYIVNCKRGRLRNRQLALREISSKSTETMKFCSSSSLHQSMSHPCIVSLFFAFSTPSARFHVLELCSGGTLSSYLDENSNMSEGHLRSVLKSLVEALLYLKKEGVVHRNIRPSNVLLTTDGRVKLCDFELATRLPPSCVPINHFIEAPHFVAPEILANLPYTCDADLWSVGCVSIACLSGRPPFQANSISETVDKILNAAYDLPETISLEAQDLIVRMLEADPIRRIQLPNFLSHAFFEANLPSILLSSDTSKTSESVLSKQALFERLPNKAAVALPTNGQIYKRHCYAPNKTAIDDIRDTRRRNALRSEIETRRIVSDPLPMKERLQALGDQGSGSSQSSDIRPRDQQPTHLQKAQNKRLAVAVQPRVSLGRSDSLDEYPVVCAIFPVKVILPIGTTSPVPFTTALLSPEIHKTVHGQISVLPSHSMLVDLREGERRRGQKGTEVLLIDSQGTKVFRKIDGGQQYNIEHMFQIDVYSAPHLSLPTCLAEPSKRYTIDDLPSVYWRQYNDAAILVERIKQRTPKLILHAGQAKCTLMANTPPGDVELLFPGSAPLGRRQSESAEAFHDASRMRIRLSRQCGSLEIAKHISGARGEEWTKKDLKTVDEYPHISAGDWNTLDSTEQDNMVHLARFWRVCDTVEQLEDDLISHPYGPSGTSKSRSRILSVTDTPPDPIPPPASFSSTQTLSLVNVAPRPPKLPLMTRKMNQISTSNDIASIEGQHFSATGRIAALPTWCREDFDLPTVDHHAPQTKFIPSVGWCIRHNSRVSQGGRYKIMFFDGAVLEIDVDEDWAELTSATGEKKRHNIRDCSTNRQITERMKVFGDFVSMFDEPEGC